MTELACAFAAHWHRADICQRLATTFFRTAKGTLWPLCPACCERHKVVAAGLIKTGKLSPALINKAEFDIPITSEVLATYCEQDGRIAQTFDQADTRLFATLCEP